MNIIRFGVSIIALLTVTKSYAIESDDLSSGQPVVSRASPAKNPQEEKNEEKDDLLYEVNVLMLKSCIYCFPKFNNSHAKYIIPVCEKLLGETSNTSEEMASIYVHRGVAWHQLGDFFKAHKDFQIALGINDSDGYSVLMKEVRAEVLRHIATYKMRVDYLLNDEDK